MKNFSNKKILILAVIFFSLGFLYYVLNHSSPRGQGRTDIGQVTKQDIVQRVTIAGTVIPLRKTIVTAPYNGYIKKLFVKIGDKVKQGDPLVTIVQSLQSGDGSFPLRSPLNGQVAQIEKSEGEFVKEGDSSGFILRIDDSSKLSIIAYVPEIDRVKLKNNQEAVINASAILDKKYKGIIRDLSLAAREKDQWSRSQVVDFPVRIDITDSDETIRPGMSVVIDVITAKKEQVLTLRHEFIRRENQNYYVILSTGKRKDIQVGIQNEEGFEITGGLTEADKIKQVDFSDLTSVE